MRSNITIGKICLVAALCISTVYFTNCKKEEKKPDPEPTPAPAPAPPTNTQKLTGKNFKQTASTVDPGINTGSTTITNWYGQTAACEKDDLYNFKENGTLTWDEGGSKCDPSDPQTTSGTWVWSADEKVITIKIGAYTISATIITNDGTTLKYSYSELYQGTNYTFTDTYTKQ